MDIDGPNGQPDGILDYHDVDVSVYASAGNGALVGIYDMEDLTVFGTPYSNRYPDIILPIEQRNTQPPGKAWGSYVLLPHYEWATTNVPEDNDVWYSHWEQKMSEHAGDTWYEDGTTYVAFDKNGNNTRINYLFRYPFNASAGRHEGDLPTIRVTIDSQDPSIADIVSVSYPIHGLGSVRPIKVTYDQNLAESLAGQTFNDEGNNNPAFANKYFALGQTHPVSFGGGFLSKDGIWGYGSHAQYPSPGKWHRTKALVISLDEFVVAGGLINLETVQFNFNNYQNIKLIPPRQYVIDNLRQDPNFNWLVFGGLWGHWRSLPTAGANGSLSPSDAILLLSQIVAGLLSALPFVEIEIPFGNTAPLSPYRGSLTAN